MFTSLLIAGFFRNHGDQFLDHFKPHLERLVRDPHEASQRCAAEIITGLIRGSKHWPFAKSEALWNFLAPLLRAAFNHVSVESINDWVRFDSFASLITFHSFV